MLPSVDPSCALRAGEIVMSANAEPLNAASSYDPYRNFRFRLKLEGRYVAGVSKVSALTRTTETVAHRPGGDPGTPRRMPGQTEYEAITLERGVTHDVAFAQWVNKVWDYHSSITDDSQSSDSYHGVALADFRKDIVLELFNEAGQKVLAYNIYRCWPSEFHAMPELDPDGNAVAIQSLKLENEGWERDTSVGEPTEPSFTLPGS
jgi:phage tail-like protein